MELSNSVLKSEITNLNNSPQYNITCQWELVIHAGKTDIKPLFVNWMKVYANFTTNFSDEIVICATFKAGDYDFDIFNNRDNLTASLIKVITENNAVTLMRSVNIENTTRKYRAKLMELGNDSLAQNLPGAQNKQRLNDTQMREVKIQLIHPVADYLRKMSSGGVFSEACGADMIRAYLGFLSRKAAEDVGVIFKGVDVASGYSEDIKYNIVVPEHTEVPAIPKIINEEVGGIYPTGFWYYLQNEYWYVYPKLDLQRYFTHTGLRLRILNVPNGKLPDSPKTFMLKDRLLTIFATGETKVADLGEVEQENKGNGIRFIDPVNLFNDYVKSEDGKAVTDAKKVVTEVAVKARKDNTNYTTMSNNPLTSRYNIEYSKLAARVGMLILFTWENAAPEFIYPGMPCSFVYMKNEATPVELTGVVSSIEYYSKPVKTDIKERTFTTVAAIQVYVGDSNTAVPIKKQDKPNGV